MEGILQTRQLSKSFGALAAVKDVSLSIAAGSLHSVIGPNGAGKTTLFNLLTGTFPPTSGEIIFDKKNITGTPARPEKAPPITKASSLKRGTL